MNTFVYIVMYSDDIICCYNNQAAADKHAKAILGRVECHELFSEALV